jgi:UDP-glucose 4-epimerase
MTIRGKQNSKILITGGAGFMGRWVAKHLVSKGHRVWILDNLSNGSEDNIQEFYSNLSYFIKGDIKDRELLSEIFKYRFDICIHLAASINVQKSIDDPRMCFDNNVAGTFNILEECRKYKTKLVFISSALIYETAKNNQAIKENHTLNPTCPYAASKIAGEQLVLSYYKSYKLPVVILRPFSIYGPWQRTDSEGGVISIFMKRKMQNLPLEIYGNGKQSRDFFYVEDCAEFIEKASFSDNAIGQIFNAGSGKETKIKTLAENISDGYIDIKLIEHHHQHAEIMSMLADSSKAEKLLKWQVKTGIKDGIEKLKEWLISNNNK